MIMCLVCLCPPLGTKNDHIPVCSRRPEYCCERPIHLHDLRYPENLLQPSGRSLPSGSLGSLLFVTLVLTLAEYPEGEQLDNSWFNWLRVCTVHATYIALPAQA